MNLVAVKQRLTTLVLVDKEEKERNVKDIPGEEVMMQHRFNCDRYSLQKGSKCSCSLNKQGKVVEVKA